MLKLRNIIIMIFLSVGFLLTSNVKALEKPGLIPDTSGLSSHLSSFGNRAVAIYYNPYNSTWYYFVNRYSFFRGGSSLTTPTYTNDYAFNYFSNYWSLSTLSPRNTAITTDLYRFGAIGYYDTANSQWVNSCTFNDCAYIYYFRSSDHTENMYLYSYVAPANVSNNFIFKQDANSILYSLGYNLSFYETIYDYFDITGNYSYFTTPNNVYASHTSFNSDDLEVSNASTDLSYFNHHMYYTDNSSDEYLQLGAMFEYLPDYHDFYDNNYEFGFILTYKYEKVDSDNLIVVNATTKSGTYSCSVTDLDYVVIQGTHIVYQSYVNCPSVPLTTDNDDFLRIRVNAVSQPDIVNTSMNIFDSNFLFTTNKAYFGISQLLKKVTSVPPVPVVPDTPSEPDINDSIVDINDSINSGALPDNLEDLVNFAGYLPPGPVDSILTLPLTFMNNYYSAFTSSSCNPVVVPIPFLQNQYFNLPCGNTLINNMGFTNWWETIGAIFGGYCLYKYLLNLYKWVDSTLTFRENTLPDWGGA